MTEAENVVKEDYSPREIHQFCHWIGKKRPLGRPLWLKISVPEIDRERMLSKNDQGRKNAALLQGVFASS